MKLFVALVFTVVALSSFAQNLPVEEQYYVADIELQTAEEFQQLLERAEQFLILEDSFPEDEAKER